MQRIDDYAGNGVMIIRPRIINAVVLHVCFRKRTRQKQIFRIAANVFADDVKQLNKSINDAVARQGWFAVILFQCPLQEW